MAKKRPGWTPLTLLKKYYDVNSLAYRILVTHSTCVKQKALFLTERVSHLNPDRQFIAEAAMLHDIGIFMTNSPKIGCEGEHHYLAHGYLGRELLEKEGLPRHALVCERHTGAGLTVDDIRNQNLPLPHRDMRPQSLEEQIVCFADMFYSKNPEKLKKEKSLKKIKKQAAGFGERSLNQVNEWIALFGLE